MNRRDFITSSTGLMLAPVLAQGQKSASPIAKGVLEVDFNAQQKSIHAAFRAEVAKQMDVLTTQFDLVGGTAAVIFEGKLVAASAAGVRKYRELEALRTTDPMHIGSNTKGMTALLAARIIEQGKLRWDTTLGELFKGAARIQPEYRNLKFIELLWQRTGFSETSPFETKYNKDISQKDARLLFAYDTLSVPPTIAPGTKHEYRNANFIVVGAALEQVTKGTWEDLMRSEVLGPLNMKYAGFGPMGNGTGLNAPWQHIKKEGIWDPLYHDNPPVLGPAGRVHCSALDLANYAYVRVLGSYGRTGYLAPRTWQTLQNPPEGSSYACGIATSGPGPNGVRDMSHGGSNNMSCSDWWVRHEGRLIVVSMINCQSPEGNKAILEALQALAERWAGLK